MTIAHVQTQNGSGFNTTGGATTVMTTSASLRSFFSFVSYDNNSSSDPFTSVSDKINTVASGSTWTIFDAVRRNGISNQWSRVYTSLNRTNGGVNHELDFVFAAGASSGWHAFFMEVSHTAPVAVLATGGGAVIAAGATIQAPTANTGAVNAAAIIAYCGHTASNNPATPSFDNSIVVPTNGSLVNGTTQVCGGVGTRIVAAGFNAAPIATVASSTPSAGMFVLALKELTATGGNNSGRLQGGLWLPNAGFGG